MNDVFSTLPTDRPRPLLARSSRMVMWAEAWLGAALVLAVFLLLLANVVSRGLGMPLVWTDELAVHLMVWLAFLGASICIGARNHMAVGMLPEALGPSARARLQVGVDLLVLGFLLVMAAVIWNWLDLMGLARAGWSGKALAEQSFNFVYTDPTLTLGLGKIWFWMIMPFTALSSLLHASANLQIDLALLRAPKVAEGEK